jgi:hypothetical protein
MQVKVTADAAPVATYRVGDPLEFNHLGDPVMVAELPLGLARDEMIAALYNTVGLLLGDLTDMTAVEVVQTAVNTVLWLGMDAIGNLGEQLRGMSPPVDLVDRAFLAECIGRVDDVTRETTEAPCGIGLGTTRQLLTAGAAR